MTRMTRDHAPWLSDLRSWWWLILDVLALPFRTVISIVYWGRSVTERRAANSGKEPPRPFHELLDDDDLAVMAEDHDWAGNSQPRGDA